jgi:hypothetical protein
MNSILEELKFILGLIKRLFCTHKTIKFVRNIYGDEILLAGYKRSLWKCEKCNGYIGKHELVETDCCKGVK